MPATSLLAPLPLLPDGRDDGAPHLPGYELLGPLGRSRRIFRARQAALDRIVAVQFIRPEAQAGVRRFRRAARAAARLTHPHIVAVLDAGRAGKNHFMAMEYVAGADLGSLVRDGGSLPPLLACDWVRQAALALANAHGLSHGHVKPSKLLVGGGVVGSGSTEPARTTHYSSPAIHPIKVAGFGLGSVAEPAEDLYGLGCTLYYLLSGQMPFAGRTRGDTEPAALRRLRPDIPAEVAAIAHRLLARQPADRFQNAAHVTAALAPFSAGTRAAAPLISETEMAVAGTASSAGLVLRCPDGPVTCLAVSPDGRQVAAAGPEPVLHFWDLETGEERRSSNGSIARVLGIAFAGDGQPRIAGARGARLCVWNVASGTTIASWRRPGPIETLALAADRALTGGADQYLRLWEVGKPRATRRVGGIVVERHWGPIRAVALAPDGRRGLSGSDDGTALLWDLETGHELRCFRGHAVAVVCVAFTPDGRRVLTGAGRAVRIWDVATGDLLLSLAGHERGVRCLAFAADGRRAASGADDGTVRLWDPEEGRAIDCFTGHLGPVLALAFAPDGRHVVSGSTDGTVRVWRVS